MQQSSIGHNACPEGTQPSPSPEEKEGNRLMDETRGPPVNDATRRIFAKQTRWKFQIQYLFIPLPVLDHESQCHCDSAEILMEYRERSNDGANVLHYELPPLPLRSQ